MIQLVFNIFLFCYMTDKVFLGELLKLRENELARWYFLHSFLNGLICLYSLKPMYFFIQDPIYHTLNPIHCCETNTICMCLHIYHLLFFKCTSDDIFHHLGFVVIGGILQNLYNYGFMLPFYMFFICGLPGGIDYFLLGLVKLNKLSKEKRLKISVKLNNWIRVPGVILSWNYVILFFIYGNKNLSDYFAIIIGTFCSVYNTLYYNEMVLIAAGKMIGAKNK